MIIQRDILKDLCAKIQTAADSSESSPITETLLLKTEGNFLTASMTNREYYVTVKVDVGEPCDFRASVKADVFLKLISKITTDTIELIVTEKDNMHYLQVVGNGKYKVPILYDGTEMLDLPEIELKNPVSSFDIDCATLLSVLNQNSKQFVANKINKEIQRYYYVDNNGVMTHTRCTACVNAFNFDIPVPILFNQKLVKLFKLFKSGDVHCTLSIDTLIEDQKRHKIKFETDDVVISAELSETRGDNIKAFPVNKIKDLVNFEYPNVVEIDANELLSTIDRLSILVDERGWGKFKATKNALEVSDCRGNNRETIYFHGDTNIDGEYVFVIDLASLRSALDCSEQYVTLAFGNGRSVVVTKESIKNVVSEEEE